MLSTVVLLRVAHKTVVVVVDGRRVFQLQHLLFRLFFCCFFKVILSFCCSFCALRSLCCSTCRVMARNISSTLILSLADVSNSSMSIWRAKRCASSVMTTFRSGSSFLLPTAIEEINYLLLCYLDMHSTLPNTLLTTSQLFCISSNHRRTFANDSPFVTSYTMITPCVPR